MDHFFIRASTSAWPSTPGSGSVTKNNWHHVNLHLVRIRKTPIQNTRTEIWITQHGSLLILTNTTIL
jgi:hypothetical protein